MCGRTVIWVCLALIQQIKTDHRNHKAYISWKILDVYTHTHIIYTYYVYITCIYVYILYHKYVWIHTVIRLCLVLPTAKTQTKKRNHKVPLLFTQKKNRINGRGLYFYSFNKISRHNIQLLGLVEWLSYIQRTSI